MSKENIIQIIKRKLNERKANKEEKKDVEQKAIEEGEKIFMKNRPDMADKLGNYPKANMGRSTKEYDKEANRTNNQVIKTRLEQWKQKNKNNKK